MNPTEKEMVKWAIALLYEKDMVFYDEADGWYSRKHGRHITNLELWEMLEWEINVYKKRLSQYENV